MDIRNFRKLGINLAYPIEYKVFAKGELVGKLTYMDDTCYYDNYRYNEYYNDLECDDLELVKNELARDIMRDIPCKFEEVIYEKIPNEFD